MKWWSQIAHPNRSQCSKLSVGSHQCVMLGELLLPFQEVQCTRHCHCTCCINRLSPLCSLPLLFLLTRSSLSLFKYEDGQLVAECRISRLSEALTLIRLQNQKQKRQGREGSAFSTFLFREELTYRFECKSTFFQQFRSFLLPSDSCVCSGQFNKTLTVGSLGQMRHAHLITLRRLQSQ